MKNTQFNKYRIKKICESKLGIDFKSEGKEFSGWFRKGNKKVKRITVSKGRDFPKRKTYGSMAKQLNLKIPEFDDLLVCSLDKEGYEKILDQRVT